MPLRVPRQLFPARVGHADRRGRSCFRVSEEATVATRKSEIIIIIASVILLSVPVLSLPRRAWALEAVLSGADTIRVWKDPGAMQEGLELIQKGVSPDAIGPLLSCVVPSGTRADVDRVPRSWLWEALIREGPQAGCRGVVSPRDFRTAGEGSRREGPAKRAPTEQAQQREGTSAPPRPPGVASPGQERQGGVPQLSAHELARQGYAMSRADAERLEEHLKTRPDDLAARTRLLGYYFARSLRLSGPAVRLEARRRHISWVVQYRPDSDIAGMSETTIDPTGHSLADPEGYGQVKALWLGQVKAHKSNPAVLRNAAWFFRLPDKEIAARILKQGQSVDPKGEWESKLGYIYALAITGINLLNQNGLPMSVDPAEAAGPFAKEVRTELEKSNDAGMVGMAGHILSQYGLIIRGAGMTQVDYGPLAEKLLRKAQALQPTNSQWSESLGELYKHERMVATSPEAKAEFAKKALEQKEKAIGNTADDKANSYRLMDLAKAAFEAGEMSKAQRYATQLVDIASRHKDDEGYGPAVHDGNMVLGRLALRAGDTANARAYLIKSGRTLGGGTLTSFGPNMSLAKDLLEKGEKETVIEYLELCKKFWTHHTNELERWIQTIRAGGMPNFGANLVY